MSAPRPVSNSLFTALLPALRAVNRWRATLATVPSFGITSRLMIAFIGIGALLLVANFIVEENVMVERTTQITRIAPAPAPPTPQPIIAPAPPAAVIPQRRVVTSESLVSVLDRFERAVQGRVATKTEQSEAEYQQSSSDLETAASAFATQAASISGKSFQKLSSGIDDYRTHAAEVAVMADHQQVVVAEYSALFEDLYARVNNSVKSAWTIFGRVVARQSLLQLSSDFDDLRRGFTTLASADDAQTPDMVLLLKTEQTIVANRATNEAGFRRSQGDQWYSHKRDDVARLVAMRGSLLLLNRQLHARTSDLAEEARSVALLVPQKVETPLAAAVVKAKIASNENHGHQAPGTASPVLPGSVVSTSPLPDAASDPAVVETQSVKTLPAPDHHKRVL